MEVEKEEKDEEEEDADEDADEGDDNGEERLSDSTEETDVDGVPRETSSLARRSLRNSLNKHTMKLMLAKAGLTDTESGEADTLLVEADDSDGSSDGKQEAVDGNKRDSAVSASQDENDTSEKVMVADGSVDDTGVKKAENLTAADANHQADVDDDRATSDSSESEETAAVEGDGVSTTAREQESQATHAGVNEEETPEGKQSPRLRQRPAQIPAARALTPGGSVRSAIKGSRPSSSQPRPHVGFQPKVNVRRFVPMEGEHDGAMLHPNVGEDGLPVDRNEANESGVSGDAVTESNTAANAANKASNMFSTMPPSPLRPTKFTLALFDDSKLDDFDKAVESLTASSETRSQVSAASLPSAKTTSASLFRTLHQSETASSSPSLPPSTPSIPTSSSSSVSSSSSSSTPPTPQTASMSSQSYRLDEETLKKEPEDVFDLLDKLGEGSYGAVHKARHKTTGRTLAIKVVAVDTDLQEIIKEISIMQQCDSDHVVKYFGSYFKRSDLWIVMEYCGGGSVADIMRLRRCPMEEAHIQIIAGDILKGLSYLHAQRKIHRDIKAGNILLSEEGHAKLADFGVAGQLSDSMAKRNTVIGTPYWMAPEVIQEIGYDEKADIWSVGITCIEMAEGRPPHAEIHPMRAIFMIPTRPPPTLHHPTRWAESFNTFLSLCLIKSPASRYSADQLLKHEFITSAPASRAAVVEVIHQTQEIIAERGRYPQEDVEDSETQDEELDDATIVRNQSLQPGDTSTVVVRDHIDTTCGTMVINEDADTEADTMKQGSAHASYKPAFLAHFEQKEREEHVTISQQGQQPFQPILHHEVELSEEELLQRIARLDEEMERELQELKELYQTKRDPITRAIEVKRATIST
eukprot:m.178854 g.178854  ORF g.178854 m.178854 type:complete len:866 (-) comp16598_c2_seq1:1789-4386(-)